MRMRLNFGNSRREKTSLLLFSVLLLSSFGFSADIHPQAAPQAAKSASAVLQISVNVVPTVQAATMAPPAPQTGPVKYQLETLPREQTYETRLLSPDANAQMLGQRPAILKTLVVVPQ